jgi:hypothetical protein
MGSAAANSVVGSVNPAGHLAIQQNQRKHPPRGVAVVAFPMRVDGVLRGMNREASCRLRIWQESSSTGRVYLRCAIMEEPEDLLDGSYTLFFGGHRVSTRKWEGHWLLRYLPRGIELQLAA